VTKEVFELGSLNWNETGSDLLVSEDEL